MKYFVIVFLLLVSIYPLSYVRYVWSKKNYIGALGMVFITMLSFIFPVYLLFTR